LPSSRPTDILVYGAGGHARSICSFVERIPEFVIVGLVDDNVRNCSTFDWPVHDSAKLFAGEIQCRNIVLAIGNNLQRQQVYLKLSRDVPGVWFPVICAPTALVSRTAHVEEGTVVFEHSIVNAAASVGFGTIINTGAIVEHDCQLGRFSSIGPGAVICGAASLGERSILGANGSIIEKVVVGDDSIVGAGSVVIADADGNSKYVGSPARKIGTGYQG